MNNSNLSQPSAHTKWFSTISTAKKTCYSLYHYSIARPLAGTRLYYVTGVLRYTGIRDNQSKNNQLFRFIRSFDYFLMIHIFLILFKIQKTCYFVLGMKNNSELNIFHAIVHKYFEAEVLVY